MERYTLIDNPSVEPVVNLPLFLITLVKFLVNVPERLKNWLLAEKDVQGSQNWKNARSKLDVTASVSNKPLRKDDVFGDHYCAEGTLPCNNLILDKTGHSVPFEGNVFTRTGNRHEKLSLALYAHYMRTDHHRIFILPGDDCFGLIPHPKYSWIGISPDGIAIQVDEHRKFVRLIVLEIKNPFRIVKKKQFADQYYCQLQLMMDTLDIEESHLIQTNIPIIKMVKDDVAKTEYAVYENDYNKIISQGTDNTKYHRTFAMAVHRVVRNRNWFNNIWLPCAQDVHNRLEAYRTELGKNPDINVKQFFRTEDEEQRLPITGEYPEFDCLFYKMSGYQYAHWRFF